MKPLPNLILASQSPRRKQLLSEAGFDFEVKTVPFEETFPADLNIEKVAEYLATEKNKAHRSALPAGTILTADTVVIFLDKILGKPADLEEARQTLKLLSGKVHQVMTGVCISSDQKTVSFTNTTEVKFRELSGADIDYYLSRQPPLDKAGSYGIQDWIGMMGVEWIKGSYYNVVGLPIDEVYGVLRDEFNR